MNPDRLIHDAKAVVLELAATGYRPPVAGELPVFGEPLAAEMKLGIYLMRQRRSHHGLRSAHRAQARIRHLRRRCRRASPRRPNSIFSISNARLSNRSAANRKPWRGWSIC